MRAQAAEIAIRDLNADAFGQITPSDRETLRSMLAMVALSVEHALGE